MIPVKVVHGATVYMRDVAHVRDGYSPQTNIVHVEGRRSVLMRILKQGSASTLDVVRRMRDSCRRSLAPLPKELKVALALRPVGLRARVGRGSGQGGRHRGRADGADAAGVPGQLAQHARSSSCRFRFRSSVSIIVLSWLGQTLNVMTLGGMALAVGILVDDATVEIENIHRNMAQQEAASSAPSSTAPRRSPSRRWSRRSASASCSCQSSFITGAAKSLFVPLAMAVVFAMLTSYVLSRTLVPTMMHYLMAERGRAPRGGAPGAAVRWRAVRRRLRARVRAVRDSLRRPARGGARTPRGRGGRLPPLRGRFARALPLRRARFLPDRRRGADRAARARRAGDADRGDGAERSRRSRRHPRR